MSKTIRQEVEKKRELKALTKWQTHVLKKQRREEAKKEIQYYCYGGGRC